MNVDVRHSPSFAVARVHLDPGEQLKAESGAMMATSAGVQLASNTQGGVIRGLRRSVLGGESLFVTTFTAPESGGWVDVAHHLVGDIVVKEVTPEEPINVTKGCWLASAAGVELDTKWGGFKNLFGGEGGFLIHAQGQGVIVLACYGALDTVQLAAGEQLVIDSGHVVELQRHRAVPAAQGDDRPHPDPEERRGLRLRLHRPRLGPHPEPQPVGARRVDPHGHARPDRRGEQRAGQRLRPLTVDPGCARVPVPAADAELVADLLWAHGATAVAELPGPAAGTVALEAGFPTEADAAGAVAALRAGGRDAELVDARALLAAALDAWRAHARPVRAGRLHVRPPWLAPGDDPPGAGEVVVVVDPSRAFGAGDHPSTRACLFAVDRWARPGTSVLDVGCGSGVLAVAAARLAAGPVVAVDVDPAAVAATLAAAAANDVAVDARLGTVADVDGRFDLVLANVGAGVAIDAARELAGRTAPGGRVVVAGLYADRAADVASALEAVGLAFVEQHVLGGWAAMIHHSHTDVEHTVHASR